MIRFKDNDIYYYIGNIITYGKDKHYLRMYDNKELKGYFERPVSYIIKYFLLDSSFDIGSFLIENPTDFEMNVFKPIIIELFKGDI